MIEAEQIKDEKIVVVGGGDSAVESAMLLMDNNDVLLSYRKDKFSRIKPKNRELINEAIDQGHLRVSYNSNLVSINEESVLIKEESGTSEISNDRVYIFAGGELPTPFLQGIGVEITKRFGYILKKHG